MKKNDLTPAYLWFDSEFTDLNPDKGRLLQVALVITDINLKRKQPVSDDVKACIHLPEKAPVSPWVSENLGALLEQCRSDTAIPLEEADNRLCSAVDVIVGPPNPDIKKRPILAGNSIHADLGMIRKHLPKFTSRLHYRILDVSSFKVVCSDLRPELVFRKEDESVVNQYLPDGYELEGAAHDAYYDILASIAEMNYYLRRWITA